jgi:hypothetical protein
MFFASLECENLRMIRGFDGVKSHQNPYNGFNALPLGKGLWGREK